MSQPTLHTRRQFLKTSILGGAIGWSIPAFLESTLLSMNALAETSLIQTQTGKDGTILVLIQLGGGNDGLNTIIPFTDDLYYQARQSLAIRPEDTLKFTSNLGFNSNLAGMKSLYDNGHLSVIQGVGYPNPNRSHFVSSDIWATGNIKKPQSEDGWLGKYFNACCKGFDPHGISITNNVPRDFKAASKQPKTLSFTNIKQLSISLNDSLFNTSDSFFRQNNKPNSNLFNSNHHDPIANFLEQTALDAVVTIDRFKGVSTTHQQNSVSYPSTHLGNSLKSIAQMINGNLSTRVYYTNQGGYDTHAGQLRKHGNCLKELDGAISAFVQDLKNHGNFNRVMIMTFSEFGRRVKENGSQGTDHGAAAPMFIIGGQVKPGLYGTHPSLSDLDDGDLKYSTDFRSVYSTILSKWLKVNPLQILDGKYDQLSFI